MVAFGPIRILGQIDPNCAVRLTLYRRCGHGVGIPECQDLLILGERVEHHKRIILAGSGIAHAQCTKWLAWLARQCDGQTVVKAAKAIGHQSAIIAGAQALFALHEELIGVVSSRQIQRSLVVSARRIADIAHGGSAAVPVVERAKKRHPQAVRRRPIAESHRLGHALLEEEAVFAVGGVEGDGSERSLHAARDAVDGRIFLVAGGQALGPIHGFDLGKHIVFHIELGFALH